jgi:hypothetical protein
MRAAIISASAFVALLFLGIAPWVRAVPAGAEKPTELARTRQAALANLNQRHDFPGFENNTPLKEALGFLAERAGVTIVIDTEAFKSELQIDEAENQSIRALPQLPRIPVKVTLDMVLKQVQADYYITRDGVITVVPKEGITRRLLNQKVSVSLDRKTLGDALKELSEVSGFTIVLDERRAGDKAKSQVTADLRNVSLTAAITIVADLAELQMVQVDRVLYVTTRENAGEIRKEQERRAKEEASKQAQ